LLCNNNCVNRIVGTSNDTIPPILSHILYALEFVNAPKGFATSVGTCPFNGGNDGILTIVASAVPCLGDLHQDANPIKYVLIPITDITCCMSTQFTLSNANANNAGPLLIAVISSVDRALRDDAVAADCRRCDSVERTARRLLLIIVVDCGAAVSLKFIIDEDIEVSSNRFFANCGIIPLGNDEDKSIGSSLHSGHISDPLPYACCILVVVYVL